MGKIKLFLTSEKGKDLLIIGIVILVGVCSFLLGRLSKESSETGLKITYPGLEASAIGGFSPNLADKESSGQNPVIGSKSSGSAEEGSYFASSKGKKYYSLGCSAGKTIKQENRIYFKSASAAEAAGYSLSSGCR